MKTWFKNWIPTVVATFVASTIALAGTGNLPQVVTSIIQRAHVNDIRSALSGSLVPRDSTGTVDDNAESLGTSTARWGSVNSKMFCIYYSSGGNPVCHKVASAPGSAYDVVWPAAAPANSNNFIYLTSGGVVSLGATSSRISVTAGSLDIVSSSITGGYLGSNIDLPGNVVTENSKAIVVSDGSPSTSLKIIRGDVSCGGSYSLNAGEGFTGVRNGTGDCTMTFTSSFASGPAVTASGIGANDCVVNSAPSTSTVRIACATATRFHFIAIGPR